MVALLPTEGRNSAAAYRARVMVVLFRRNSGFTGCHCSTLQRLHPDSGAGPYHLHFLCLYRYMQ